MVPLRLDPMSDAIHNQHRAATSYVYETQFVLLMGTLASFRASSMLRSQPTCYDNSFYVALQHVHNSTQCIKLVNAQRILFLISLMSRNPSSAFIRVMAQNLPGSLSCPVDTAEALRYTMISAVSLLCRPYAAQCCQ